MTLAIIDDEPLNRLVLKKIINSKCSGSYRIIIEEGIIENAVEKINELKPDVILLDIELKNGTGFDILQSLIYSPQIIFVTAYEKYALQAIKLRAVDYILKPINEIELIESLNSSKERIEKQKNNSIKKTFFTYSTSDQKKSIEVDDILYFEGAGAYAYCVTESERMLISKNIGQIEKKLDNRIFKRCHQSYIVNIKRIIKFDQNRNGYLHLDFDLKIPVSQRKMKEFQAFFLNE